MHTFSAIGDIYLVVIGVVVVNIPQLIIKKTPVFFMHRFSWFKP